MQDPYGVLAVSRTATADEIKRAYRQLAKKYHPDLNPDDPAIARRFQDISAAYELLSDANRRAAYDRGEREDSPGGFRRGAGDDAGFHFRRGAQQPDGDDVFEQIFGMFGQRARRTAGGPGGRPGGGSAAGGEALRPEPLQLQMEVPFLVALKGGTQRLHLASGRDIDMRIPVGTENGAQLRLPNQGRVGSDGRVGDVIVTVGVESHPVFRRDGNNILTELPIDLDQAVLGDRVTVPTIDGPVTMRVPAGSNTGTKLRLRGKGVPARRSIEAGDQFVSLRIVLANPKDPSLTEFLRARNEQKAKDQKADAD
jgi:DnaJ-class molecular chaperone